LSAQSELSSSLFSFIWKHSARDQVYLLLFTVASFPILYFTLSLPKLILNGAIEGNHTAVGDYLPAMDQVTLLWLLSALLLALIIVNGVLKMRLNIYRGMVGERLIRRLRFAMIERILDLPPEQARRISQGEAVSMITAESEPLTGVMGDAFAQPVFQLGQMLTILAFLFLQNFWLGVAGVSLIPVQAWLIPRMQREVNRLQRARVAEVRLLSEKIGESVAGAPALRLHGGRRYRLAEFSDRLQRMFGVRVEIFRRKFFIKFVNNLLTQVTPFLFYALGGYLVIKGQLSIGALVAAIAAARDIAEPWRELLTYWNAAQEAGSRYTHLLRQFTRKGRAASAEAEPVPRLGEDIQFGNVGVLSRDGRPLLDQIDVVLPGGALIGFEIRDDLARQALVDLLTGEREPDFGTVTIGGRVLGSLGSEARAARIGCANSTPFIFRATIAENIRMPLRRLPVAGTDAPSAGQSEAARTGNSTDPIDAPWHDGGLARFADEPAIEAWWLEIIDAMGVSDILLERGLDVWLTQERHAGLAGALIARQPDFARRLAGQGLGEDIEPFDIGRFHSALSIGENLLFAVRRRDGDDAQLAELLRRLSTLDVAASLLAFAADLAAVLARAFGEVGADHPLLRRLTAIRPAYFRKLTALADRMDPGKPLDLTEEDRLHLFELLFKISPRDLGSTLPGDLAGMIVDARERTRAELGALPAEAFEPIVPGVYNYSLTILENLLAGTPRSRAPARQRKLRRTVIDLIGESGLDGPLRLLIGDVDAGPGGENLSIVSRERLAVARALIRRPDILILDRAMASASLADRERMWRRIRELLPESTLLVIESELPTREGFDEVLRIREGRLEGDVGLIAARPEAVPLAPSLLNDLQDKAAALARVVEFRGLRRGQLELLAYASEWHHYSPGDHVFHSGEPTDGVYVVTDGRGELRWPESDYRHDEVIDDVVPGRMIGDLSVILDRERMASLVAVTDLTCLKIGEQEFRDIMEGDMGVALLLLRTVSGHLLEATHELGIAMRRESAAR